MKALMRRQLPIEETVLVGVYKRLDELRRNQLCVVSLSPSTRAKKSEPDQASSPMTPTAAHRQGILPGLFWGS
jgi:hypothetical protein